MYTESNVVECSVANCFSKNIPICKRIEIFFNSAVTVMIMLCYNVSNCMVHHYPCKKKKKVEKPGCSLYSISPNFFCTRRAHMLTQIASPRRPSLCLHIRPSTLFCLLWTVFRIWFSTCQIHYIVCIVVLAGVNFKACVSWLHECET